MTTNLLPNKTIESSEKTPWALERERRQAKAKPLIDEMRSSLSELDRIQRRIEQLKKKIDLAYNPDGNKAPHTNTKPNSTGRKRLPHNIASIVAEHSLRGDSVLQIARMLKLSAPTIVMVISRLGTANFIRTARVHPRR